jgi:hypothetical protein
LPLPTAPLKMHNPDALSQGHDPERSHPAIAAGW